MFDIVGGIVLRYPTCFRIRCECEPLILAMWFGSGLFNRLLPTSTAPSYLRIWTGTNHSQRLKRPAETRLLHDIRLSDAKHWRYDWLLFGAGTMMHGSARCIRLLGNQQIRSLLLGYPASE